MDNSMVISLLKNYRSYKFALDNLGGMVNVSSGVDLSRFSIYEQRKPRYIPNNDITYDGTRYSRIISLLDAAIDYVLSDNEREVIRLMYLERNKLDKVRTSEALHIDRKTVTKYHDEAIDALSKALYPINEEYAEINNLDFMLSKPA